MEIDQLKSKVHTRESLAKAISQWRLMQDEIVFTNGCFDLLHEGHLKILMEAKSQGQRLIVGANTDASVKSLKGENRPIKDEDTRALCLAALYFVDAVILFEEETPDQLIRFIVPDVLVKGADYTLDKVVGADFVMENGGRVHLVELVEGKSSTKLIGRL